MADQVVIDCSTGEIDRRPAAPVALPDRKGAVWQSAKIERDSRIDRGVTIPGIGTFDSDPVSRANINGAVTMALIAKTAGQPFSIGWKLADNTVVTIASADQMIAIGVAIGAHVAACHGRAQEIGIALAAATDGNAVDAIDLAAGWPA